MHPEKLPKRSDFRWRFEQSGEQLTRKSAIGCDDAVCDIFF
jgi:hypothetical protein